MNILQVSFFCLTLSAGVWSTSLLDELPPRRHRLRQRVKFEPQTSTAYHTTTTTEFDIDMLKFSSEDQRVEFGRVNSHVNHTQDGGYYLKVNMSDEYAIAAAAENNNSILNDAFFRMPTNNMSEGLHNKPPVLIELYNNRDRLLCSGRSRIKRFAVDQRLVWDHENITWSLFSGVLPPRYTRNEIAQELGDAFMVWQKTTTWQNESVIYFTALHDNNPQANIKISFERGDHNDSRAFDGPGRVLAHTFLPPMGSVHFDVDEDWRVQDDDENDEGISLFLVAVHEIGHALGLLDTSVHEAIMYGYYDSNKTGLATDDINGLTQLYVDNPFRTTSTTTERATTVVTPTTTRRPVNAHNLIFDATPPSWLYETSPSLLEICAEPPAAVAMLDDKLHMVVGGRVWVYDDNGTVLKEGAPLDSVWSAMCDVDAVAQLGETVFATRGEVWFEFDRRNGSLKFAGRVQDVLGSANVTRIDALLVEDDERLYATYENTFYVLHDKRVVYSGPLRYKFRGVGLRLDYFVHLKKAGVYMAGVGRGYSSVQVVSKDSVVGNVYQSIKRVQRLMDQC
ncbi:matrix metalloproteinase-like protein [Betabaculovirus altermyunipunctae]|uniref:Matrix metalloproteinase-like protein n=1 Tax=Betabaculovirus altermyunipunctae TaxID=3051996 RepID=A0A1S5YEC6_9BBAC|nr:matrix metalloproteinase-like protein [Betabaculovirus altermyunipunctae]AQQ80307.1 matrix metalloproteinase-like protein [Betabaculovirus altermyunipunctae]